MDQNIDYAINIIEQILPILDDAEGQLKSARNWSFVDMLGGGLITDLIKHHKLNNASDLMDQANDLLQSLSAVLSQINVPQDCKMEIGGFLTFADFVFDGLLVDVFMASKIFDSIDHIHDLRSRLNMVYQQLERLRLN